MSILGDNLSNHPHLQVLSAESAEGLRELMMKIRLPYRVLSIYADSGKHYAFLSLTRPIKIKQGEQ